MRETKMLRKIFTTTLIMFAWLFPVASFAQQPGDNHQVLLQVQKIRQGLQMYFADMKHFPTAEQGLQALWKKPEGLLAWRGAYASEDDSSKDLWGTPLKYLSNADDCAIFSAGLDRIFGTNDDLSVLALAPPLPKWRSKM
jgi:hypothetical protein